MGLEPDYRDYLKKLHDIFEKCKSVLKNTGTCWVNLGDTYAGSGKGAGYEGSKESWHFDKKPKVVNEPHAKSQVGIPQRFYIDMIDSGWIARNYIIWHKNNAMPSSAHDRMTNKYEPIMFFSKSQKYYLDIDPIREPCETYEPFNVRVRDANKPGAQSKLIHATEQEQEKYRAGRKTNNEKLNNRNFMPIRKSKLIDATERKNYRKEKPEYGQSPNSFTHRSSHGYEDNNLNHSKGKNPGDIWRIPTRPYPEAHFATFPPELPSRIISIATRPGDTILDPFFGAGTTALAAEKLARDWIGVELNPKYVKLAKKRLNPYMMERLT